MENKIYQQVTDRIISELERGAAPWIKPWTTFAGAGEDQNIIRSYNHKYIDVIDGQQRIVTLRIWLQAIIDHARENGKNVGCETGSKNF